MDALHPHTLPLIRKLESITTLSDEEKAALLRLPMQVRDMRPDQDVIRGIRYIQAAQCSPGVERRHWRQPLMTGLAPELRPLQGAGLGLRRRVSGIGAR